MSRLRMTATTIGLIIAGLAPSARAGDWDKETHMTVNGPLQVQNTVLAPGQYVFRLTQPDTNQNVVSIYNADGTRLEPPDYLSAWLRPPQCRFHFARQNYSRAAATSAANFRVARDSPGVQFNFPYRCILGTSRKSTSTEAPTTHPK